jgi:hypothetical protein
MSISTNGAGVACCGNCGHELAVICTGGCAEPDIVFKSDHFASAMCNWPGCDDLIAPREPGQSGPDPRKCAKHKAMQQVYRDRSLAKKAAS